MSIIRFWSSHWFYKESDIFLLRRVRFFIKDKQQLTIVDIKTFSRNLRLSLYGLLPPLTGNRKEGDAFSPRGNILIVSTLLSAWASFLFFIIRFINWIEKEHPRAVLSHPHSAFGVSTSVKNRPLFNFLGEDGRQLCNCRRSLRSRWTYSISLYWTTRRACIRVPIW